MQHTACRRRRSAVDAAWGLFAIVMDSGVVPFKILSDRDSAREHTDALAALQERDPLPLRRLLQEEEYLAAMDQLLQLLLFQLVGYLCVRYFVNSVFFLNLRHKMRVRWGTNDAPTKRMSDDLMPEADAVQRNLR